MLDWFLEVASFFDWISPLMAGIQDLLNGPSHTFLVPEACGWSGRQIEQLLRAHGIRLWGKMVVHGSIMFTVPLTQARWAQHLLAREGIPIQNPLRGRARRTERRRGSRRKPSMLDTLHSWLDALS